ncbi:hypothetical protein FHY73_18015 [Bacillus tropicus]|nr:hypothetical protein FHY73_18015 [Bacillus tropicus]
MIFSFTLSTLVMLCGPPNKKNLIFRVIFTIIFLIFIVSINKFEAKLSYQSLSYRNLKQYSLSFIKLYILYHTKEFSVNNK